MKLAFDSIAIENFKSFIDEHELSLSRRGVGLHFLRGQNKDEPRLGSNGAGKTTTWDALCWCLYGRTPDGLRNPDIKPWFGDKATTVIVHLRVDDEKHVVSRTTFPNQLHLDGKPCGQEDFDSLLGMNVAVFTHTVLLGQGQPLFFDLTPKDKMALFSEVLNLDRWDKRSADTAKLVVDLERELSEWQGRLQGVVGQLLQIDTLAEKANASSKIWEDERVTRLEKLEDELKAASAEAKSARKQADVADLAYESAATEARQLQRDIDTASEDLRKATLARDKTKLKIAQIKSDRRKVEDALANFKGTCPACGQTLKGVNVAKHKKDYEVQIAELACDITAQERVAATQTKDVATLEQALQKIRTDAREFLNASHAAQDNLDGATRRAVTQEARVKQLQQQRTAWQEESNPFKQQVQDLRRQRKQVEVEQRELTSDVDKRLRRIERCKFWVKGFKDVRLLVVDDVLQELQLVTESMLVDVGLLDWSIQYATHKETQAGSTQHGLNVLITSPKHKQPVRWESWSGGEGQRLRIVGALALSEVLLSHAGVYPELEVLDEPTQHLSTEGVKDLCGYLAQRARELKKQIWYIDHLAVESSDFTSVLSVVKTKKGSAFARSM